MRTIEVEVDASQEKTIRAIREYLEEISTRHVWT